MSHQENINLTTNQTKANFPAEFSATPTLGGGGGGGITHLEQMSLLHKHLLNLFITIALATLLLSCGPKVAEPSTSAGGITASASLQSIIEGGTLAGLENSTDSLVTNTLTHLTASANYESAKLKAIYATESGAGDYSGSGWGNAIAATNLRKTISNISDATATKVYAVLVASGTYKPVDTTIAATTAQRNIFFSMKNHVAIIGGFAAGGGWGRTGTTTFSGDIGTKDDNSDNSHRVFAHGNITLDNGLLYGVTITKGNGNSISGGGMLNLGSSPRLVEVRFVSNSVSDNGGGMYNEGSSSPVLTRVEFVGNSANLGGGMYNSSSSSVLTGVEFVGNSADNGGGMYNTSSSLVLRGVVFSNNSSTGASESLAARGGGGMYNTGSSPVLRGVVFVGNSANNGEGGGMFNVGTSSPVLVGAVFSGNSAKNNGGGMYSYNIRSGDGPVVVNSIFVSNSATTGADIVLDRSSSGNNINVRVAGSVLGVGTRNATNGIVVIKSGGTFDITYHSLTNGAVNFGSDDTTSTATGGLTYPTIQSTSSAVDIGLYVQRKGTTNYFSQDNSFWHTEFSATGGFGTAVVLPTSGVEDLTAVDIAGNARNGRPDAGVSEYTP